jgi:hypothetical protein
MDLIKDNACLKKFYFQKKGQIPVVDRCFVDRLQLKNSSDGVVGDGRIWSSVVGLSHI